MAVRGSAASPPFFPLPAPARARLARSVAAAVRAARTRGEALAAVTVRVGADVDPAAVVCASRRAQEPWFVFENPDRDRAALAALGCVRALDARGPDRFARVAALRAAPLPLLDPDPADRARVASVKPPEHYEAAVARAVERIRAGELEKIVLAREVAVHAAAPHDAAAVHGVLREAFPTCFVFAAGRGDATFLAASPELLLRREGLRLSTMALAGSARRSADPAVDDYLGERLRTSAKDRSEHDIVIRRIERALRPLAVWVTAADEPVVVKVANIQHLASPVRAQLAAPRGAIELAGIMHPTPAVGAEPLDRGAPLIPARAG